MDQRRRRPSHGDLAGTVPAGGRRDLTDVLSQLLEPLLPATSVLGAPIWTRRQLINGIRWRIRTGAPWRDVPERHGSWQ
ncbi:transposase [Pseudonocardia sp. MH-G8]|uniref:transposase n=1 Tax=Pseudonocardia sp. MH-G8 TaxID=1854588 RepID=UPI001E412DCB|nr:transposase [Pseudonocardia sp. MH-G8]